MKIHNKLLLGIALGCLSSAELPAATAANAYVTVSSSTEGVESIVPAWRKLKW